MEQPTFHHWQSLPEELQCLTLGELRDRSTLSNFSQVSRGSKSLIEREGSHIEKKWYKPDTIEFKFDTHYQFTENQLAVKFKLVNIIDDEGYDLHMVIKGNFYTSYEKYFFDGPVNVDITYLLDSDSVERGRFNRKITLVCHFNKNVLHGLYYCLDQGGENFEKVLPDLFNELYIINYHDGQRDDITVEFIDRQVSVYYYNSTNPPFIPSDFTYKNDVQQLEEDIIIPKDIPYKKLHLSHLNFSGLSINQFFKLYPEARLNNFDIYLLEKHFLQQTNYFVSLIINNNSFTFEKRDNKFTIHIIEYIKPLITGEFYRYFYDGFNLTQGRVVKEIENPNNYELIELYGILFYLDNFKIIKQIYIPNNNGSYMEFNITMNNHCWKCNVPV